MPPSAAQPTGVQRCRILSCPLSQYKMTSAQHATLVSAEGWQCILVVRPGSYTLALALHNDSYACRSGSHQPQGSGAAVAARRSIDYVATQHSGALSPQPPALPHRMSYQGTGLGAGIIPMGMPSVAGPRAGKEGGAGHSVEWQEKARTWTRHCFVLGFWCPEWWLCLWLWCAKRAHAIALFPHRRPHLQQWASQPRRDGTGPCSQDECYYP
jgi:hypothetical protein